MEVNCLLADRLYITLHGRDDCILKILYYYIIILLLYL